MRGDRTVNALEKATSAGAKGDDSDRSLLPRVGRGWAADPCEKAVACRSNESDARPDRAALAEKEIASGKIKGPAHGVPVAIKDLCWVKGAPAAHGMTIHREFRPNEDATVVARLKDAGAIILGKLQQTEGA